jgi:uroporphyrinogen III methyltransferase/synthase
MDQRQRLEGRSPVTEFKPRVGKVYLVGAGPGDPGLLTLKGLECLRSADLVLYDGLVNPLLLRFASGHAERTHREALAGGSNQAAINERLIDEARAGKTVVRLKGGDPYIFGRGSEEAAALAAAEVEFEVVPGVTAAVAAGEYAGLSFTHRQYASAVAFITGHEDPIKGQPSLNYEAIARFPGTLVFYMGLQHLEGLADALIRAGLPAQTPACLISSATNPGQRTVVAPLGELPVAVQRSGVRPPSVIVIGECVTRRETIAWYERLPLFGRRIGITRPVSQAGPIIERVLRLGAEPVLLPTIEILPPTDWEAVDATLARIAEFDWLVFTSVNGVDTFFSRVWETGGDARRLARTKIAAIGPATGESLARFGLRPDLVPREFRAESLAEELVPQVGSGNVLWARADRGRDVLPKRLAEGGARVEEVVVYRNVDVTGLPPGAVERLERGELDWIGLGSPSIVQSLSQLCPPATRSHLGRTTRLASISPVTSARASELGLEIAAEATSYTWDGVIDAILRAETGRSDC